MLIRSLHEEGQWRVFTIKAGRRNFEVVKFCMVGYWPWRGLIKPSARPGGASWFDIVRVYVSVFLAFVFKMSAECNYMQEVYGAFSQDNRLRELLSKGIQNSKSNKLLKSVGECKLNPFINCPDSQCSQCSIKNVSSTRQNKRDMSRQSKFIKKGKTPIKGAKPLPKVKSSSNKINILDEFIVRGNVEQSVNNSSKQCGVRATQLSGVGSLSNHSAPGLKVLKNICENDFPVRKEVFIPTSSQNLVSAFDDSFIISEEDLKRLDRLEAAGYSSKLPSANVDDSFEISEEDLKHLDELAEAAQLPSVDWDSSFEISKEDLQQLDKLVEAAGYPSTSHSVPVNRSQTRDAEEYPSATQIIKESPLYRSQAIVPSFDVTGDLLGSIVELPSDQQVQGLQNLIEGTATLVEGVENTPTEAAGGSFPSEDTRSKLQLLNTKLSSKLIERENCLINFQIIQRKHTEEMISLDKEIFDIEKDISHL